MSKLVVGCGYLGRRLANLWLQAGQDVSVTTRSPERARALRGQGFSPIVLDVTDAGSVTLPAVDTVVYAVGFDRTAGHAIHEVYVDGLRHVLRACQETTKFIHISSTGVYGQSDGEWVNEESICAPNRASGLACLNAETLLRNSPQAERCLILRLAGIYGPDRLPQIDAILGRQTLQVASDAYLNLIHVDDAVRIIARSETELNPPLTLCISDGHPIVRKDFYLYLSRLLRVPPPTFAPPPPGTSRAERGSGSKRICNDRLREVLPGDFLFASYQEGLASIVSANKASS